ncbi:hypothetical protein PIB30_032117 [Stylosanthes scabra]|uniref:Protein SIEVE ELEMENT OCCLUSION B-like n=1 Tax=Stylosanthes scabra TaxID=79078 RepID=A0ABU6UE11_9FABA|nr:hypothetical protein [Stylosanthes scabra]
MTNTVNLPLNPFNVHDVVISPDIKDLIRNHDNNAETVIRRDVNSLFNIASEIVCSSSSANFPHSLDDLQQVTVDLVEHNKVPESALRPTYSFLREIATQMTKDPFKESNAHKSVVEVLEKLESYRWDAKAVIALSAFALDFGDQTWRLSLMQGSNNKKENALELHVFRLAEEEKKTTQLDLNLIKNTLELIKGIIELEEYFADKSYNPSNVSTLFEAPLDVYTYWAVFSIFACANNQVEPGMKNKLLKRITDNLKEIDYEIDSVRRRKVFRNPQGILKLLEALTYPNKGSIISDEERVTMEELKTVKKLFLFISPLDNIEREIEFLELIFKSITKDRRNKGYKILWVPVVENWTEEAEEKFKILNSKMPWYVLKYFSPTKGYRVVLQQEWNYQGNPIVVVADAFGKVCNKNALPAIFLFGLEAFPYDPITIGRVSRHWNWIWLQVSAIHPPIQTWVTSRDKYVFLYGGTDAWTQKFHGLVDGIKKELAEESKAYIEHFKVDEATDTKTQSFWNSIKDSLQKNNVDSTTLREMQSLEKMRSQKGWAIVSKGKEVVIIGYNEVMLNVLNGFKEWRGNISESCDFDGAIYKYYTQLLLKQEDNNIHSPMLIPYYCCPLPKEISSLACKCYHGFYYCDDDDDFPLMNGI